VAAPPAPPSFSINDERKAIEYFATKSLNIIATVSFFCNLLQDLNLGEAPSFPIASLLLSA
jgi:hypothetical protein